MSRLGKKPVELNPKVKTDYKDRLLQVKGPLGEMKFNIPEGIEIEIKKENIQIVTDFNSPSSKMMAGTIRSIVNNMVQGVTTGFTETLNLNGVGYRAKVAGQSLTLNLGFSHTVEYKLPKTVKAEVEGNTKIVLTSCDKQILGQTTSEIRKFRPPEPYKGKGILFDGEHIRRKAGKAAKAAS